MLILLIAMVSGAGDIPSTTDPAKISPEALLGAYERVREPLARDQLDEARTAARSLGETAGTPPPVVTAATGVRDAPDAQAARLAFGDLSRTVILAIGDVPPEGTKAFRCGMAEGFQYWLQPAAGISNPYMGLAMPACGEGASWKAAQRAASQAARVTTPG